MIDAAGPWGTGPFTLVQGASIIDAERAVVRPEPFACTWLWPETRDPEVKLVANPHYWDTSRGPHLKDVVFRNDVPYDRALGLVCDAEGEVDVLTELAPADAARVRASDHARLVTVDAIRTLAGVINRDARGLPLADQRARLALNLAVDRDRLIRVALGGHADPLAGLVPPSAVSVMRRLTPYAHDPQRAEKLWRAAGGGDRFRPLRIATFERWEAVADRVAADIRAALGIGAEVVVHRGPAAERAARRGLAEKAAPQTWDVLLLMHAPQMAEAVPLELHRAFVGADGEYRAGPTVPEFEARYAAFAREPSAAAQTPLADRLEQFVYDEALALFLAAPYALYAVNRHVEFTPYRTTFELAEYRVGTGHWSRR